MQSNEKSVWFYTFHKCASSVVSFCALRNALNLEYVDYEAKINNGEIDRNDASGIEFSETGKVYAPIRLTGRPSSAALEALLASATEEFVESRRSIFMVRDPRDVLVSQFLSFTGAHIISEVPEIAREQEAHRDELNSRGIDSFVINSAEETLNHYLQMNRLLEACRERVLLTYEQMVCDYVSFIQDLCVFVRIPFSTQFKVYLLTRPRRKERPNLHKRMGAIGEHRSKLAPKTIDTLNSILAEALELYGYET